MINRKEIYTYLGYRGKEPDGETSAMIEEYIGKVQEAASPAHAKRRLPIRWKDRANGIFAVGSMEIESRDLARNLQDCEEVFMFAATLGAGIDRMISRAKLSGALEVSVIQAVSAALTEEYCDEINAEIDALAAEDGLYTRPRFSPGFGDLDLSHQKEFLAMLEASKRLGIKLTDGFLMIPSKSVTAFVGVSPKPREKR